MACSGKVAAAGAQADGLDGQRGQRPEPFHDGRQDCGPRRRGQLHLDHRFGERNAFENLGRGGRRQGHPAVGRLDPALAGRDRTGLEAVDAQQVQAHSRPDDIDDRINGPDLVKVDLGQVDAVNSRLGLAQPQEDPLGQVFLPGGQAARVDDRFDMVPVAMGVLVRGVDLGRGRPEAALLHGLERDASGKPQARHGLLDRPGIDPGVHQGARVMSPEIPLKQSKYPTRTPSPFTRKSK